MIICVIGPTGSGKSELAEKIAKYYNAIIVNFDAYQLYKEMDIGTAKPSKEELATGKYFLYDFINPNDSFDVSKYQSICRDLLKEKKKENIVLVGGTGLYLKAALYDYKFEKEDQMNEDFLKDLTNEELFVKLNKIDPVDANKIGVNNRKRLLRALFIYKTHGVSKTDLNKNGKNKIKYRNVKFIGLDYDREYLYNRINKRVDKMFDLGLEKEVKTLFEKYGKDYRSLQAIGYKEFTQSEDVLEVKELIKQHSRNYAKRQLTFFKHQFRKVNWFNSIEEAFEFSKKYGK